MIHKLALSTTCPVSIDKETNDMMVGKNVMHQRVNWMHQIARNFGVSIFIFPFAANPTSMAGHWNANEINELRFKLFIAFMSQ